MERIAALVEGHTELHFIRSTYANSIVSRPIPNGKSVAISLIVESIVDAVQALGGKLKESSYYWTGRDGILLLLKWRRPFLMGS